MAPLALKAANFEDHAELIDRCFRAAEVLWRVDNLDVLMPIFNSSDAIELRGTLQSMGLNVFSGTDEITCGNLGDSDSRLSKLIIFHASDWRTRAARKALETVHEISPQAVICVVTGLLPLPVSTFLPCQPVFDDARALFQVAGIGFFSLEGTLNERLVPF